MESALVGERLREARHAAGLSQQGLADLLGTHVMVVSSWERNARLPNIENLNALASALGVSADYLLGRANAPARELETSDLSDFEQQVVWLLRRRDLPALLRAITDINDYVAQKGVAGADEGALDERGIGGGQTGKPGKKK